ncbi:MAG TPA: FtsQ-type POTRA domain-containing protein [Pyrinomonadaceae bacterium]|nr:FtsQ-type POTRA domain-containing protein [Pyrinomonadaceae bacterium]
MAKKKTSSSRSRASSVRVKTRKASPRKNSNSGVPSRVVLPLAISGVLIAAIAVVIGFGYRTATASEFFKLRTVDVRGNDRTSADDIKRIVTASAEKSGVWNADLGDIRTKVEKFPFVKAAAVSMQLPASIRVNITERVPAAIVHLTSGDFLVDSEGTILAQAMPNDEKTFPFQLQGWDETKTEKAVTENVSRLKMYKRMVDEWQQFDLSKRVKQVNLANPREPVAVVEDSGRAIQVTLARDNLGKSLKTALEALTGKGAKIRSVDMEGASPVIQYLGEQ